MRRVFARVLTCLLLLPVLVSFISSSSTKAQSDARTFPETGKTVQGRFLQYWDTHGGLAQQGYPISEELQEKSDTDGKTYTVQYFERAVFEYHPENPIPNDLLLSLLGVFLYTQKYPGGAPNQQANTTSGSQLFNETGKHVGGDFLQYWQTHGGLAQQGYPISEEFTEVSDLDGKTYTVQYFERAVFEKHPENAQPFNVLLSQLGTFRYRALYPAGPSPIIPTPVAGCSSHLAPGTWAGPYDWSFTLTSDNGLTGNGSLSADLSLDIACDGTFTGTATATKYNAQAHLASVQVLTCSMTTPPIADFMGRVVVQPSGLHLLITGGTWRQGATVCKSSLSAPQTQDLTGFSVAPLDVQIETISENKITGSQLLSDPALNIIKEKIASFFPNANVTITTQGHWELTYNPTNTP